MSWSKRLMGLLALALCPALPAHAADMTLRIGSSNSPDSALGRGLNNIAALVEKANVGLTVKVFPSGQLGAPEAQVQNVKLGVQDGFFEDLTWWSPFASDLSIAGVPFEFNGRAHFQKWLASDAMKKIEKEIIANGRQRVIIGDPLWWRGPYRVMMTTKPVATLDDIKKIKLRQPAIEALTRYWGRDGLGSNVVNIGWGDVYLALKQGAADGVTLPLDLVESTKFVEVAHNIIITDEFPQILVLGLNEAKWQAMTPEQQKVLVSAINEAGKGYNAEVNNSEQKWKEELTAQGGVFTTLDRAPFVAKVQELDKKFEAQGYWPKALLDAVNALR
jgi:TRAP-type C4-dicarboxylate transport system substrate-binding protein